MKTLVVIIAVGMFAAFAWLSLPGVDRTQSGLLQQASGTGMVVAIEKEKRVVTISHGAMPALSMPPMTMAYSVKNKAQLADLKPMQKVEFKVAYDGKDYVITDIK
jgi:Cu(I)/Ag(I) efflux system protein CusF